MSEIVKFFLNHNKNPGIYFWSDQSGHEVDCIVEQGQNLLPIEIKSGQTIQESFFDHLSYWRKLAGVDEGVLIYGGKGPQVRSGINVVPWFNVHPFFRSKI